LYICEAWSVIQGEEQHRLKVSERRVLKTSEHKRYAITEGWRQLYNEELHNLYLSNNNRMMGTACGMHG
jgi:hypothetical protein